MNRAAEVRDNSPIHPHFDLGGPLHIKFASSSAFCDRLASLNGSRRRPNMLSSLLMRPTLPYAPEPTWSMLRLAAYSLKASTAKHPTGEPGCDRGRHPGAAVCLR